MGERAAAREVRASVLEEPGPNHPAILDSKVQPVEAPVHEQDDAGGEGHGNDADVGDPDLVRPLRRGVGVEAEVGRPVAVGPGEELLKPRSDRHLTSLPEGRLVPRSRHNDRVEPCIFCSIVAGEAPCWKVYEDEETMAFLDIGQATIGHTLVVPRRHVEDIWSISEDDAARITRSVHRVAQLIHRRLDPLGINVAQSNGHAAWQEVFRYHVHLIPRYGGDDLRPRWRPTSPTSEVLAATQARIVVT